MCDNLDKFSVLMFTFAHLLAYTGSIIVVKMGKDYLVSMRLQYSD